MRARRPQDMPGELGQLVRAQRAREDQIWSCACGWTGPARWLRDGPGGIRVCQSCGGSGGLVLGDRAPRPEAVQRAGRPRQTKLEQRYEAFLQAEQAAGRVLGWRFQPLRLVLSPGHRLQYEPDFLVIQPAHVDPTFGERVFFVECKPLDKRNGKALFVYEDSRVKVKAAAELFRWTGWTFVVVWPLREGGWGTEVL